MLEETLGTAFRRLLPIKRQITQKETKPLSSLPMTGRADATHVRGAR